MLTLAASGPYRNAPGRTPGERLMATSAATDLTALLRAWSAGDAPAADQLLAVVYQELRRQASRCLARERSDHTLLVVRHGAQAHAVLRCKVDNTLVLRAW